jgi:plasmid stabilization system protein ParE
MRLRVTPPALADIDEILTHIASVSPAAAARVSERIDVVMQRLVDNPHIGRATDRRRVRYVNTAPYPYLIFYEPTDAAIMVPAVRHGARDPRKMPARPG